MIDPDTLNTLDRRQLSAGLAESIKMAATSDRTLFEKIEQSEKLEDILDEVIEGSLRIKRDVVQQDPTEKGLRRVLNFGHTVGHAIESAMVMEFLLLKRLDDHRYEALVRPGKRAKPGQIGRAHV